MLLIQFGQEKFNQFFFLLRQGPANFWIRVRSGFFFHTIIFLFFTYSTFFFTLLSPFQPLDSQCKNGFIYVALRVICRLDSFVRVIVLFTLILSKDLWIQHNDWYFYSCKIHAAKFSMKAPKHVSVLLLLCIIIMCTHKKHFCFLAN